MSVYFVGMFVYTVEIGLLPSDKVSLHRESRNLISPTIDHDLAQVTGLLQTNLSVGTTFCFSFTSGRKYLKTRICR
jgi:hypothetical protein